MASSHRSHTQQSPIILWFSISPNSRIHSTTIFPQPQTTLWHWKENTAQTLNTLRFQPEHFQSYPPRPSRIKTVSGSGYIAHFLEKFRSPHKDSGKLVRTTLAWTQYQSGLSYPILKHPWTPIHFVEGCYYHFPISFFDEINGSIDHTPSYDQPKLRSNDQAIMEMALESDSFTVIQFQWIPCLYIPQWVVSSKW